MLRQQAGRSAVIGAVFLAVACGSPGPSSQPAPSRSAAGVPTAATATTQLMVREFDVPAGSHPHDVSPAADGGVWYTGQQVGVLGHLDPATGKIREIELGDGSAPHGVITGPDGAAWITDSGLNAIVRVDPASDQVRSFPLPTDRTAAWHDMSGSLPRRRRCDRRRPSHSGRLRRDVPRDHLIPAL